MHITGFPMFALFLGPEDQSGPERSGSKIHRTGPRSQDLGPDPPRIRIRSGPDPDYSGSSRGLYNTRRIPLHSPGLTIGPEK
jgi:hypothetical protein